MSSMSSQWTYFKANLGSGAFAVLEKQLSGIVHTLQDPANAAGIQQLRAAARARGWAQATAAAIDFGKRAAGPYVGSALAFVARAWPLVDGRRLGGLRRSVGGGGARSAIGSRAPASRPSSG